MTDLTVTGYTGETKAKVEISTLDDVGGNADSYYWYDYTNKKGKHIIGWFDIEDNAVEQGDVTFQAGEGLWAFCASAGFSIQSAGQVPSSTVTVQLQKNGLSVANPTPVDVDLAECIIAGYTGETKAKVEISTLDDIGGNLDSYYWYDYTNKKGKHIVGWFDIEDNPLDEEAVMIHPGIGLWSFCAASGFNFIWPGVELN